MSNLDSLQSYSTSPSYGGSQAGSVRRPSFDRLPKDILEKLEAGKVDEAMQMIKELDEKAAGTKHFLIRWMMQMGEMMVYPFQFLMTAKKKKGGTTPQETSSPEVKSALAEKFSKMMRNQLTQMIHFIEQVIQFPFKQTLKVGKQVKALLHPPLIKVYQMTIAPVIQAVVWMNQKLIHLQQTVAEAIQKKLNEWKAKINDKTKPVYEWLDAKWKVFIEKQEWVKKVIGDQMQPVMRAADHVIQTIAWMTVPFQLAWDYGNGQVKRVQNRLQRAHRYVTECIKKAREWTEEKLKKFFMLFKKPILAIAYALIRVLHLLENVIIRLAKWLYKKLKVLIFFLIFEIPKRIRDVSKGVYRTMRSMSE